MLSVSRALALVLKVNVGVVCVFFSLECETHVLYEMCMRIVSGWWA